MAKAYLIKVDKNGTEYWGNNTCPRCGGEGGSNAWVYTGYTCYECGGSGISHKPNITKKFTAEYQSKLDAMRTKREAKRIADEIAKVAPMVAQYNAEFFEKQGFNQDGKTYVVLGNTFSIKDTLKDLGCKWSNQIGWHVANKLEQYPMIELDVTDIYYTDYTGVYKWNNYKSEDETYSAKIKTANDELVKSTSSSNHIGNIKDKIETKVTVNFIKYMEYQLNAWVTTQTWMYKMTDEQGNIYIWKASNMQDVSEGDLITIKGTIKDHSEYNGELQTILTRCKLV